jgi:hypothetical protein
MTQEQFAHYILNSYYVWGGNDTDDITIEEKKQKYRCLWRYSRFDVLPDDDANIKRADEIYAEITTRKDWGQFEEID